MSHDPIPTAYTLEVSTPGLDRVLRTPAHFERFVGARGGVELRRRVMGGGALRGGWRAWTRPALN
jgi:ribosome maturation factor RimP